MTDQIEEVGLVPKKLEKVVYIFNLSEDVWPFICAMSDSHARQFEIDWNANLAERDIISLSEENDPILISPRRIRSSFIEYFEQLFPGKHIRTLVPKTHTGEICEDVINDELIIKKLVEAANSVKKLTLISYSTSPQFFHLVEVLQKRGITVYTPESPDVSSAWTVNFYGSKSGIRQLAQKSGAMEPDFKVADGLICSSIYDAAMIAANKYMKEDSVVIKTNKGHSGAGVLLFRSGDLPKEYKSCEQAIHKILQQDKYWEKFPIVIESLLNVNAAVGGGFPNVEFKIQKGGKIEFLYYCAMRVDKDGVYKGQEMHESVLSERVAARVIDTGFFIGEQYAAAGYRGYFDVDFVAAKNGEMYVTESNARRTGGTHMYKAAVELIGKDFFTDSYTLSNNDYSLAENCRPTFERVLDVLKPVLFDKKTKEGVVLASSNLLEQSKFAYIVLGLSEKRALEIESQMEELLKKLTS
jgi:hypothetical protein